jgi:hypothetical protein
MTSVSHKALSFMSVPSTLRQKAAANPWLLTLLTGLFLFGSFILLMGLVQFSSPSLAGTDDHFHIRFASIMRSEGLRPAFPWLPLTILNQREFYDHHFLFHVALIPFTGGNLILGAKWASVLFPSLAFISVWWLLRGQRVPFAGLWALGLVAVSAPFLYRMGMTRPMALSLTVLVLGLHFLLTGRAKWLLPLSFIYVWLYDGFPFIVALSGVYCLAVLLVERRLELRPLIFAGAGVLLGLLINPYFPYDVIFAVRHILPKISGATVVDVGNEWYPYRTATVLGNSPLALIAFLSGTLAVGLQEKRIDKRTATAFLLAVLFGWLFFQSRRFVEYFPAFALIFAALAWAPLLEGARQLMSEAHGTGISAWRAWFRRPLLNGWLPAAVLVLLLLPGMWISIGGARNSMRDTQPSTRYSAAATWLVQNTPPGSRLFQTDWDDFPRLFFYDTHNTYLVGLDPTYLQLSDEALYERWVEITEGQVENLSQEIGGRFAAQYVFSDRIHTAFEKRALNDPGLREVYRDNEAVIYEVGSQTGGN